MHAFLGARKVVDSPLMYAKAAALIALASAAYYWLVFVAAETAPSKKVTTNATSDVMPRAPDVRRSRA